MDVNRVGIFRIMSVVVVREWSGEKLTHVSSEICVEAVELLRRKPPVRTEDNCGGQLEERLAECLSAVRGDETTTS